MNSVRAGRSGAWVSDSLPERTEVLIVGGGIQGATALYECARRGLAALLVERDDFGAGASSHSMKIIHGGLRYLQRGGFARSWNSLCERARLLEIAGDQLAPLRCRVELAGQGALFRLAYRIGLGLHAGLNRAAERWVGVASGLPRARHPYWYDAIAVDTEALLLSFLATAKSLGGEQIAIRNHSEARLASKDGRVCGAEIDGQFVAADVVLRCTGAALPIRKSVMSANLVVEGALFDDEAAVALRHPADQRHVFAVPWRGKTILGTWDRAHPESNGGWGWHEAWLDEMLAWLRPVHPKLSELTRNDVHFIHAGLLPADVEGRTPAEDSRVLELPDGSIAVQTVKWTTARQTSSLAVRRAAQRLGRAEAASTGDRNLPPLLGLAGSARDPRPDLSVVERVRRAVREEGARSLSDLLLRRTGDASAGRPDPVSVDAALDAMAGECHWGPAERRSQLEAFEDSFEFSSDSRSRRCPKSS